MDTILKTKSQKALDNEIEKLINDLTMIDPGHEDYIKVCNAIRVLCEAREKKDPSTISTELILGIGANLIGLIMILNFEKTGTITSKALNFLWRK